MSVDCCQLSVGKDKLHNVKDEFYDFDVKGQPLYRS